MNSSEDSMKLSYSTPFEKAFIFDQKTLVILFWNKSVATHHIQYITFFNLIQFRQTKGRAL